MINVRREIVPKSGGYHTESPVSKGLSPGMGYGEQTCIRGMQGPGWSMMVEEMRQIPQGQRHEGICM